MERVRSNSEDFGTVEGKHTGLNFCILAYLSAIFAFFGWVNCAMFFLMSFNNSIGRGSKR